jgi:uncharacterized repeat protein (TIGR03803 family)
MQTRSRTFATSAALLIGLLIFTAYAKATDPALSVLYSFSGAPNDGQGPQGVLTIGADGVLYGTTTQGGACGTVFALTPPAASGDAWTEAVLHSFTGGSDGGSPIGSVAIGSGGVLYGTTYGGRCSGHASSAGTVFSLTPPASSGGAWTETVLYDFTYGSTDGSNPAAGVGIGADGVLYGTTVLGGAFGLGTVFALTPPALPSGAWTETVLHSFAGSPDDGESPEGALIANGGVLYGTTIYGGNGACDSCGTVFSLTPPASPGDPWTEAVIYSFTGGSDGRYPALESLALGSAGVLYGAAADGGAYESGTIFSLTPPASAGGPWTETRLYDFTGAADGSAPVGGVAVGTGGVLYGATQGGGAKDDGVVFSLTPPSSSGGAWTETVLHSFPGGNGGKSPRAGLVFDNTVLYGTTWQGGTAEKGTVFQLTP